MDVDALYDGVCASLPSELHGIARTLPFRLGLAPVEDARWSRVFCHEVTLAAPALISQALAGARPADVRQATLSHLLAVIHAFAVDRLADNQISRTRELEALVKALAEARDTSLAVLLGRRSDNQFGPAEEAMHRAIAEEKRLLYDATPVSVERYLSVSLDKQRVGLNASVALAWVSHHAADAQRIEELLGAVALGLQLEDDAADWQDDFARHGAWAVCLARGLLSGMPPGERRTEPNPIVTLVHRSGVLGAMMRESERQLAFAAELARSIGAQRLSAWATTRAARARKLACREEKAPGYLLRARQLAPWAAEVLR